jgi:predicted transcriptional regulator
MVDIKTHRRRLGVSLIRLAMLSGVSRWRLWESENGATNLTAEEQARLKTALREEAARLQGVLAAINLEDSSAA